MRTSRIIILFFLLFACSKVWAQQTPQKQAGTTPFKIFFEKVYLHTDRNLYSSGEDIWFKAYFVNAQNNQLTSTSNNLYAELISPELKVIARKMIRLTNGTGTGDFKLKNSVPAGNYLIRAYTNWMRNYGDNFIFEKKITVNSIYNIKPAVPAAQKNSGQAGQVPLQDQKAAEQIQFFPEGGSMIEGLNGLIAFKAEDREGQGIKVSSASIITSKGDTITSISSTNSGFGVFSLLPLPGVKYQVKGKYANNSTFSAQLPAALPSGFGMHVADADTVFNVLVGVNTAQLNAFKNRTVTLTAKHGGHSFYTADVKITGAETKVSIPKKNIPAGITAITLYDDQKRPHCERLIYNASDKQYKIMITPNKTDYKPKERVLLNVKVTDAENKPVAANLSVAVTDNGIVPQGFSNIESYLLLESEIKGEIENPAQYFDRANINRFKYMDLLLMTQGWRDFVWRRIVDTALNISYMPEPGITLSGRVNQKSGRKAPEGINVTLFAGGAEDSKTFITKTDSEGRFFFDGITFYGGQTVSVSAKDNKGKAVGTVTLDSLSGKSLPVKPYDTGFSVNEPANAFTEESTRRMLEQKKTSIADTIALKELALRNQRTIVLRDGQTGTRFGYPDQAFTITSKDFDYKSLRHFLLTNVNGASSDPSSETNGIVFYAQGKAVRPRFMLNRREDTFNRMDLYELPMDQVEKVTVRHLVNAAQSDIFLIYLSLKPITFNSKESSLVNSQVNGYYQARTFYSPKYPPNNAQITKPDLRTTIYWQPVVSTNDNGQATISFYNADTRTSIRVSAEGIIGNGVPLTGGTLYNVK